MKSLSFLSPFPSSFTCWLPLLPWKPAKAEDWVFSLFVSQEMGDQEKANVTLKTKCEAKGFFSFKLQILRKVDIFIRNQIIKISDSQIITSVLLSGFIK